jgi:hypothetical protein
MTSSLSIRTVGPRAVNQRTASRPTGLTSRPRSTILLWAHSTETEKSAGPGVASICWPHLRGIVSGAIVQRDRSVQSNGEGGRCVRSHSRRWRAQLSPHAPPKSNSWNRGRRGDRRSDRGAGWRCSWRRERRGPRPPGRCAWRPRYRCHYHDRYGDVHYHACR